MSINRFALNSSSLIPVLNQKAKGVDGGLRTDSKEKIMMASQLLQIGRSLRESGHTSKGWRWRS
jgi:hypothetical protein